MLAARAAPEISAAEQDLRAGKAGQVENEVGIGLTPSEPR
jgi:hypothetical protein